jgi:hypothetical protein
VPPDSALSLLAIFAAGLGAGLVNSVAGGGTLLSFPVLLWAGRDPIVANATNALALWPGSVAAAYGFRRELLPKRRLFALLLPPAILGSVLGGVLLLHTPKRTFAFLVPYLVLGATILIATQRPLMRALGTAASVTPTRGRMAALVLVQLAVAVYGGYFGAAMGIIMLAAYGLYGVADIHERNGLKNVTAAVINGVAGLYFALSGAIDWRDAAALATGSVSGGLVGAAIGRRLSRPVAEGVVVALGALAALSLLLRARR